MSSFDDRGHRGGFAVIPVAAGAQRCNDSERAQDPACHGYAGGYHRRRNGYDRGPSGRSGSGPFRNLRAAGDILSEILAESSGTSDHRSDSGVLYRGTCSGMRDRRDHFQAESSGFPGRSGHAADPVRRQPAAAQERAEQFPAPGRI